MQKKCSFVFKGFLCMVFLMAVLCVGTRVQAEEDNQFSASPDQSEVKAKIGDTVRLTVNVDAVDKEGISYSWTFIDPARQIHSLDESGNVFEFIAAEPGQFICDVKDSYGNSKKVQFMFYIDNELTISAINPNIFVMGGSVVRLEVSASAINTEGMTYQWYTTWKVGDNQLALLNQLPGENADCFEFTIHQASITYACQVTDCYQNKEVVYITVGASNYLRATPENRTLTVKPGEMAKVTAVVVTNDEEGLSYTWYNVPSKSGSP